MCSSDLSLTKLALDETVYKGIEKQLEAGKSCAEAMLKGAEKTQDWMDEKEGVDIEPTAVTHARGGVLRQLHAWLKEQDPSFGGLIRVMNRRQEFLWVHPMFEGEY